jgi:hypothetical protein
MAMNKNNATFEQIRVIIGVEGFLINNRFIPKEIGFCSEKLSSSIGLNFYNNERLNQEDIKKSNFLYKFHHGLDIYRNCINWPKHSDFESVIKTIYNLTEDKTHPQKIYIAYNNDPNIRSLLHKSGLDHLAVNLYNRFDELPSMKTIKFLPYYGWGVYTQCDLHDRHPYAKIQCAKTKCNILHEICLENYLKNKNSNNSSFNCFELLK